MFSAIRKGITFSNLVALLALFIALGGTAYAVKKLNGRNIVANSISGKKLKRNTLGGREINESKLGLVPNASHALKADDAASLGGKAATDFVPAGVVLRSGVVRLQVGQEQVLFSKGPFTLKFACKDIGGGNTESRLTATTTEAGSLNYATEIPPNTDYPIATASGGPATEISDAGESYLLAPSGTSMSLTSIVQLHHLGVPCAASVSAIS